MLSNPRTPNFCSCTWLRVPVPISPPQSANKYCSGFLICSSSGLDVSAYLLKKLMLGWTVKSVTQ